MSYNENNFSIEETYESSLDISYQVDRLSKADLHHKLRLKEVECKVLRQQIEKKEREWLAKEMTIRESVIQMKKKELAQGMEHFEMEKVRLQDYYMKKVTLSLRMCSLDIKEYLFICSKPASRLSSIENLTI